MTKGDNSLKSSPVYRLIFSCTLILFLFSGCNVFNRGLHYTFFTGYDPVSMKGLGIAFAIYMNDHEGKVPDGDKWCDEIITKADMTPRSFVPHRQDFVYGETTLALNNVGIDDSFPGDVVMLFEAEDVIENQTRDYPIGQREFMVQDDEGSYDYLKGTKVYKERWNISGGPEKLLIRPGYYYTEILYADAHVEHILVDDAVSLRWDLEKTDYSDITQAKIDKADQVVLEAYNKSKNIAYWLLAFSVVSLFFVPRKLSSWRYLVTFCISITILSSFLGGISDMVHKFFNNGIIGDSLGLLTGLATSIIYCTIIFNIPAKAKNGPALLLWTVLPGAICGGISSGLIHGTIITITNESFQQGVLPGLLFGISVGSMIGIVAAFFINQEKSDHGPISEPV